jgi:ribosomal-protein-alanine N-acetyltransferase
LHVRAANPADLPSIMRLERSSPTAAHWSDQQYSGLFCPGSGQPNRCVLVAEGGAEVSTGPAYALEGGLLGFLVARNVGPEWELENIVVASAARRQGLGRRLLDALLFHAKEWGSEAVLLEVRESNTAARHLYQKAGFQPAGLRKSYYANPEEDALLYTLVLK